MNADALNILTVQEGVIAAWQPGAPTLRAMRAAHASGAWRRLTDRTFSASPADPTHLQMMWAAALHFGPDALVTGRNALVCDGWTGGPAAPIEVSVGDNVRRRAPDDIRAIRNAYRPVAARTGVPRATPADAAVHAAALAVTDRQAVFFILSVLQQKLTDPGGLRRVVDDRPKVPRRRIITETIDEFEGGITTMGERDFSRLCREYGIRQPDRQVRRKDSQGRPRYLDVYFDKERIVVEIDGLGHLDLEVWIDDQWRQNDIVIRSGDQVLRTSTVILKYEAWVFMEQLVLAMRIRG